MPKKKTETSHFVYCSNRKCTYKNCIRRHEFAPWNVLIYEDRYEINKNGVCDYYLEEE